MPVDYPRLQPTSDDKPKAGIVHLGLGAFFRVAATTEQFPSGQSWAIIQVMVSYLLDGVQSGPLFQLTPIAFTKNNLVKLNAAEK